jgi:hypothetical protein
MATRQSEEAARLLRSALNSLPLQVVVLDREGVIRYTNRAWRTFGTANGLEEPIEEGADYLGVCEAAGTEAQAAADGIRAVLRGDRDEFSLEYDCHGPDEKRWFLMRATRFEAPVAGPTGGTNALVVHHDVTDRKLAERAAAEEERSRPPGLEAGADTAVDERVPVDLGTLARSAWAERDAGQSATCLSAGPAGSTPTSGSSGPSSSVRSARPSSPTPASSNSPRPTTGSRCWTTATRSPNAATPPPPTGLSSIGSPTLTAGPSSGPGGARAARGSPAPAPDPEPLA